MLHLFYVGVPHRGAPRTLVRDHHAIDRKTSKKDQEKCLEGDFYKTMAKAVVKNLPPLSDEVIKGLVEKERQRKYARQIKMIEGFNRKRGDGGERLNISDLPL